MPAQHTTFGSDFRRFFGRGLAVLLPSVLTLWLLWYAFLFVFNNVAVPINAGIRWTMLTAEPWLLSSDPARQPEWYRVSEREREEYIKAHEGRALSLADPASLNREIRAVRFRALWESHWYLNLAGLLVAIALIYLAGKLVGGLVGRQVYSRVDAIFARLPGLKQVYPHIKQVVDMVVGDKPMAFKRVVLVEYPRKGIWSLGLVTSNSLKTVAGAAGGPALTVFIPSTPTPFTGFAVNVAEADVIDLPISIDEAIRFVLTGGVLIPDQQATSPPDPAVAALARRWASAGEPPA